MMPPGNVGKPTGMCVTASIHQSKDTEDETGLKAVAEKFATAAIKPAL